MSNTYFKIINRSIKEKYTNSIVDEIQKDLVNQSKFFDTNLEDIFDMTSKTSNISNKLDINVLLKCYLIKQLLNEKDSKQAETKALDTANPNIKKNPVNNKFYRLSNNELTEANEIETVNNDGSYIVIEKRQNSSYKIKKIFDINDTLTSFQLIDQNNNSEVNIRLIAEFLNLKKIYTYKFKYSGYSGDSADFITGLLNKFNAPLETGYYMDKYFNYYEWSPYKKAFIRNQKAEITSPYMVDYEFASNGNVIRKEYTGVK